MSEQSICLAKASIMVYNNEIKKWEHAGGPGISQVHVYQNLANNSYRIVGRKAETNEVVLNCAIAKNLKYNKATATFHQWRDQRQVFGLNFRSPQDANTFSEAVESAIKFMNLPPESHYAVSQNIEPKEDAPAPVPIHRNGPLESDYRQFTQDPFAGRRTSDTSHPVSYQRSPQPPATPPQPPSGPPPATSAPLAPPAPPAPPPAAPAAPPPPPAGPPPPPAGPPPAAGGPPPPPGGGPPPPPPPPAPGPPPPPSGGGGGGLLDGIANIKLKKRSEVDSQQKPSPPSGGGGGGLDMMAQLQKKLNARKQMTSKSQDEGTTSNGPSTPSPSAVKKFDTVKKAAPVTEPKKTTPVGFSGKQASSNDDSISSDQLKALKTEILNAFKIELQAVKEEILEEFRKELSNIAK